ncbi:hypothetical protein ACFQNE_01980 [Gordonia phosphorivorans]|uniref:Uncharacterized protein n=1 Tax=Gordonia phosphorivorans TaxID=1056982 RepID=A0ABV6H6X3_9ACTN
MDAKTNRLAPVDADASEYGNVSIHVDPVSREPQQVVLGKAKAAAMRAAGQPLYLSHFASCPHAYRWRKDYR